MEYIIYIQSQNGFPIDDWAASAYFGFKGKQASIVFFEDIDEVPPSPWNIVVGSLRNTDRYFQKLGIPPKNNLNIPEELLLYAGRKIEYMSIGDFKKDTREPIFVKPNGRAKAFVGGVLSNCSSKEWLFHGVPDDEECLLSEVVEFVSEYRGYVIRGELKGIKHYRGDFKIFPDMKIVDEMVSTYKSSPSGYSLDVGVTDDGRTLLVECNDGFSLGNYGLEHSLYTSLLTTRWLELMKENGVYGKREG